MNLRIGNGVDFHKFAPEVGDFQIMLGGVEIPYKQKLLAHSDGDVILHSMCDCIFGAIGNGNIGTHFPNTDEKWKGVPSSIFLKHAFELLKKVNGEIINFDVTVMCEAPKVMFYASEIQKNISSLLNLEMNCIGVKAVTTEKMGFLGRGEGIACIVTGLFNLK